MSNRWITQFSVDTGLEVTDPATDTVLGAAPDLDTTAALAAVAEAATAMADWRKRSPRERSEVLRACWQAIVAETDSLAELMALENGKTMADARAEVSYAAEFFRWYAEEAVRLEGRLSLAPAGTNKILVSSEPIGVAVLVTPWNFPAAMATRKIAPALAAGCGCVLKPAAETPYTALAVAELCRTAGVPEGLLGVVTTSDSKGVVAAMLADRRVRALSFTGSTTVGRQLMATAAERIVRPSLELGGNAPAIVLSDADLDVAVAGIMVAKMRNTGQACTAANRILVHSSLHDELAERLGAEMGALVLGPGTDPATGCGPLIHHRAVDRIAALVREAVDAGARLVTGGAVPDRPGSYLTPTVLADVRPDARVVTEEVFGPVAPLVRFDTDDEAVALANDTEYGLSSYLFGRDLGRALGVADRVEAGMVAINRGMLSDPAAPFGGVKQSGLGREGSHDGIAEFTETKYVAVSW